MMVQVSNFQVPVPTCTDILVLIALYKLTACLFTEIPRLTQDPKTINSKTLTWPPKYRNFERSTRTNCPESVDFRPKS